MTTQGTSGLIHRSPPLTDDNEATFKKLIVDAGVKYLKPLNPSYRLIELNGNCKILGVVVDARWLEIN
ncbi:hypothetical protein CBW55_03995 [Yersinia intermedia]|nr:hypothetical protein CBW55_03995 [Yersinia intermedia]OWF92485.1 hypothetical protein B4916_02385 [Yersinia intermedia]